MNAVITIAINTFIETIRNKVLYNILLVAAGALLLTMSYGDLSLFSRAQVLTDFGLATMSITGLLLAIFIGVGLLGAELSTKTVYVVVSRPVSRAGFIAGKFCGLVATLILNFALIALVFFISIRWLGLAVKPVILYAVLLLAVEMALIVAASVFFSTFTSPTLAAIFTVGFYVAGHLNDMMGVGIQLTKSPVWRLLLETLNRVLPNLEYLNIRSRVVYDLPIPDLFVVQAAAYGILYTLLLLLLAMVVFSRKDL
jgi:ABC-type transport system involved in multi-copper enzyme maturation permease subunit